LIAENPEIAELDVNPLLITADDATALDARVVLDRQVATAGAPPYSHLAIRPYPDEYIQETVLKDGARVLLRPIRPEDEPMWHALLKNCSQRSIWMRFRYLFKETTHEMATRFCFVDYDRTMAIVAEIGTDSARELIGVARLVADADHRDAEFAILVADAWQGRGLGTLLTDFCFKICRRWGIERVLVETTTDNQRMQSILRHHDFEQRKASDGEVLYGAVLSRA
jgi:acetyltransferase